MKRPPEPEGTKVRWRQGHTGTWHYGYLRLQAVEADGSLRVWETSTGAARSLPASALQHETRGPRGGRRWEWMEPRPTPIGTAACVVRPDWDPPEGPADLFTQQALFTFVEERKP